MSAAGSRPSGSTANSPLPAPNPSATPPTTATTNLASTAPKAQKQSSSGSLSARAMAPAKSFESTRSSRGSKDSLIARSGKASVTPPPPSPNDELLKTFRAGFDDVRSIITCKICYGLLYEPYTTSCGHTYCYACFCKSFQPRNPPSCPECRGKLTAAPAPAFIVREMTAAFMKRPELLPPGETIEQHKGWQKEHADTIQADKDNKDARKGGLWRGLFRPRLRRRLPPLRDAEDGVDRCPYCGWELEDEACDRCGLPIDENGAGNWDFSEFDQVASEHNFVGEQDLEVEEYDMEDDFYEDADDWQEYDNIQYVQGPADMPWDQPFAIQRMLGGNRNQPANARRPAAHSAAASRTRYSASIIESEMGTLEEEDEDEDSSMSGFIDDGEVAPRQVFVRESTSNSSSHSSGYPPSIAEGDEEDEEDEGPIAPVRRRTTLTQSSTPTLHASSNRPSQARPQIPEARRRRTRVISETPSSTSASGTPPASASASSAPAEDVDEEDEGPIAPISRRRRRGMSQEEPTRRVRPRPRSSSISEEPEGFDPRGYRPLGTPHIGDGGEDENEQSDGGRTTVGWEPITNSNERTRNTGSLTPIADRSPVPPRPASRTSSSRFPLGSRGIRRRSSVLSVSSTVHYEDNDADDDVSDSPQPPAPTVRRTLNPQISQIRLNNTTPGPLLASAPQPPVQEEEFESDDTEPSPHQTRHSVMSRRRAEYNPTISLMLAQHQTEMHANDVDRPVYAEFEHLRGLTRTPLARPRTANRNRDGGAHQNAPAQPMAMSSPAYVPRHMQNHYNPTRFRGTTESPSANNGLHNPNTRPGSDRFPNSPRGSLSGPSMGVNATRPVSDRFSNSPRSSISGPSQINGTTRFRNNTESTSSSTISPTAQYQAPAASRGLVDDRVQASGAALYRSMYGASAAPPSMQAPNNRAQAHHQVNASSAPSTTTRLADFIDRPVSRVNYRAPAASINRPPSVVNRPPSVVNRPPSVVNRPPSASGRRGSLTRAPFSPPQMGPVGVGLNTARAWHPSNPFFSMRPRTSTQRLRPEPSSQTLRQRPSVQVMRNQPLPQPAASPDPELDSPTMRPQASRIHLRPQPSYRRLQAQRDAIPDHPAQNTSPSGQRYSPGGSSTLSEDERQRRANDLVRRRQQELAQLERANLAPVPNQRQAAAQVLRAEVEQRLASTAGRIPPRQPTVATTNTSQAVGNQQTGVAGRRLSTRPPLDRAVSGSAPAPNTAAMQARARQAPAVAESSIPTMAGAPLMAGGDRRRN